MMMMNENTSFIYNRKPLKRTMVSLYVIAYLPNASGFDRTTSKKSLSKNILHIDGRFKSYDEFYDHTVLHLTHVFKIKGLSLMNDDDNDKSKTHERGFSIKINGITKESWCMSELINHSVLNKNGYPSTNVNPLTIKNELILKQFVLDKNFIY
jgi:hypothetical protein